MTNNLDVVLFFWDAKTKERICLMFIPKKIIPT